MYYSTRQKLPNCHIERPALYRKMEGFLSAGNLMVSAPSGYGKSTLVNAYMEAYQKQVIWISSDGRDISLPQFVDELSSGITDCYAESSPIAGILKSSQSVQANTIVDVLKEFLLKLSDPLILVIDDFHGICNEQTLELIQGISAQSLALFRVIIISREKDLPIPSWETAMLFRHISFQDLKFSDSEAIAFLRKNSGTDHSADISKFEGWPAGLTLFAENGANWFDHSAEILVNQTLDALNLKLEIVFLSELKYFNESLIQSVIGKSQIIDQLKRSPLIVLELENGDFRFHHFIRDVLQKSQTTIVSQISSNWWGKLASYYLEKGEMEEAWFAAKKSQDTALIMSIYKKIRLYYFNNAALLKLQTLFEEVKSTNTLEANEIAVNISWNAVFKGDTESMISLISTMKPNRIPTYLRADFNALMAYSAYASMDFEEAVTHAEKIIDARSDNFFATGYAYIFKLGSLQAIGKVGEAYAEGESKLGNCVSDVLKSNILLVLCYISRMDGSSQRQSDYAKALLKLSRENQNIEGIANALCFLGETQYDAGQFRDARKSLKEARKLRKYTIGIIRMSIAALYAKTEFAFGNETKALESIDKEISDCIIDGNTFLKDYYYALKYEFKRQQAPLSRSPSDVNFLLNFSHTTPMTEVVSPGISKGLTIILEDEKKPGLFDSYFDSAFESLKTMHNRRYLGELLLLKLGFTLGQGVSSKDIFVLLPPKDFKAIYEEYFKFFPFLKESFIGIAEFSPNKGGKLSMLTNRESQIVGFYPMNLTDQEISDRLHISLSTVKRHNANIFRKLGVKSKKQVVLTDA